MLNRILRDFLPPGIRRRQIDGGPPHWKLETGIGQRRRDAVARLLHRRIRQPNGHNGVRHARSV
jgi:hypothetical protein